MIYYLIVTVFISIIAGGYCINRYMHMRKKLSASESKNNSLLGILSSSQGGYYYYDAVDNSEDVSFSLSRILSLRAGDFSFSRLCSYFPSEESERLNCLLEDLKAGKKNFYTHLQIYIKEQKRIIESSGYRINDHTGNFTGIVIWFHDVTQYIESRMLVVEENKIIKTELDKISEIFTNIPIALWHRNNDLSVNYCNDEYLRVSGGNRDLQQFPELCSGAINLAKWVQETKETKHDEGHAVLDGKRHLMSITEVPVEGGMVGFGYDITYIEKLRNELGSYISMQSDLLESTSNAAAIFDSTMKLKFYNNAYLQLWDLDDTWLNENPGYSEILELLREKRKLPEQANFPKFKQEHLRWFTDLHELHNEFFHLPDGKTLRLIVIPNIMGGLLFTYEDVTDSLVIERSYNTLMAVQKATLDNLHEAIAVFASSGCLTLYNPIFADIWGLDNQFLDGSPHISDVLDKVQGLLTFNQDWEEARQEMIGEMLGREPNHNVIERTDGKVLDSIFVPLPDGSTLATYIDITDTMLLERSLRDKNEALESADRLKTEFLANVSYELRSPLTSIVGFAEILENRMVGELNDKQMEYVKDINQSSQYLITLINDTLDLATIDAGYMKLDISEFDVHRVIRPIVSLVRDRAEKKGVKFDYQYNHDTPNIAADKIRLKQLLFKLLSNAIKFTNHGGFVTLDVWYEDSYVVFDIKDNGIGIDGAEKESIFDKFYTTSNARNGNLSGAGLGLSIAKNFVDLHNGRIDLQSESGNGTQITCYIPITQENL